MGRGLRFSSCELAERGDREQAQWGMDGLFRNVFHHSTEAAEGRRKLRPNHQSFNRCAERGDAVATGNVGRSGTETGDTRRRFVGV